METRELVAYALIIAILIVPFFIVRRMRVAARRERRQAERPIRLTRDQKKRD